MNRVSLATVMWTVFSLGCLAEVSNDDVSSRSDTSRRGVGGCAKRSPPDGGGCTRFWTRGSEPGPRGAERGQMRRHFKAEAASEAEARPMHSAGA